MELRTFFRDCMGLMDEKTINTLTDHAVVLRVSKRKIILSQGEIVNRVLFLMSGGAKYFSVDADEQVHIDFFALRQGYPVMPIPLVDGAPSPVSIETLTESEIVSIPWRVFHQLYDENRDFKELYADWLTTYLMVQKALIRLYYRDATARYKRFLKMHPNIIEMASQKDIACFLNMTPERLSNIKRQLKEKNTDM